MSRAIKEMVYPNEEIPGRDASKHETRMILLVRVVPLSSLQLGASAYRSCSSHRAPVFPGHERFHLVHSCHWASSRPSFVGLAGKAHEDTSSGCHACHGPFHTLDRSSRCADQSGKHSRDERIFDPLVYQSCCLRGLSLSVSALKNF